MNGKTYAGAEDTTVRGLIARWLRPAGLTPAAADALRGCFPVADADPGRFPAGLAPAEAEAVSRGLYPAALGHDAPRAHQGAARGLSPAGGGGRRQARARLTATSAHDVHHDAEKESSR